MAEAKSIFSSITRQVQSGLIVAPALRAYLFDAQWPEDFTITFSKGQNYRPPDGWFHPSEHPTWPARMLYFLMTQPEEMQREYMEHGNTLAVTMGTAVHGFIEVCLKHIGLLLREHELIEQGFAINPHSGEPMVEDKEAGSRGSMDGIIRLPTGSGGVFAGHRLAHFEFKTTNNNVLQKVTDLDLDDFISRWPSYYAQAQEYLRMSGLPGTILVFVGMGYPWHIREFHIPANPRYQTDVRDKYLLVRHHVAAGKMPDACCTIGSKESKSCPARFVCPVGSQQ
jgi:hypothetical protein